MRNVIVQVYLEIDDWVVFQSITEKLEEDVTEFLEKIKQILNQ